MNKQRTISRYQYMWVFAMFDLPTNDKEKRKEYTRFRKDLISDGFTMLQFSVYARFCESRAHSQKYIRHIQECMPAEGKVRVFTITDKQFAEMINLVGFKKEPPELPPEQLMLF